MLNEILTTKVETKEIPAGQFMPGQPRDVSSIVSKYIPIGISREKAKQILVNMNQHFEEEGNIIHAGYLAEFIPMVPRAGVVIKLTFNKLNFLETIDAHLSYQQWLMIKENNMPNEKIEVGYRNIGSALGQDYYHNF